MELRVLMLLVSVTTMADGNRDGWEYWGGSCLCEYTAKGERVERVRFANRLSHLIQMIKYQSENSYSFVAESQKTSHLALCLASNWHVWLTL